MSRLPEFFELLREGGPGLDQLFAAEPKLDDPKFGRVEGAARFKEFADRTREWLGEGKATLVATTDTAVMSVAELVLDIDVGGKPAPLPVALAADISGNGLAAIRIYHSMWPLLGHHVVRAPLLPEKRSLPIPDAIGRYHQALTDGDLDGIMAVFEDDGYAREPAGGPYVYQGKAKLREFYGMLFANEGGIMLEHCTLTDDGIRAALEYNAVAWGKTPMPPQAGIAVYERGESGLLHAARIYDDVDPPL